MGLTTRTTRVSVSVTNAKPSLEPLEDRKLFAVSIGSDGWTDVTPSSDTRTVYVSSSAGSDANGGLSAGAPVKTLAKARSLLRDGSPDHMLLKRNDVWTENLSTWTHSGRSQQEPMVIGTYGTGDRPTLNTGTSIGFKNADQVSHLAILGIHFHAHTRDTEASNYNGTTTGNYGFHSMGKLDDVLVEDTVFDDYTYNLSVTGYDQTITGFTMRRSIITDAWSTSGKSQGMYIHKTSGLKLEQNLFDHNGWNGDVTGAQQNIYSHGVYFSSDNDGVIVRGNIISDSSSHGIQARSGGIIENNVFLRNPINLLFGGGAPTVKAGGVSGRVSGNVFLDSRSINGSGRGTALELSNIKAGANVTVSDNIFTADTHRNSAAITFGTTSDATNLSESVGLNDLTIRDNIVYDWQSAFNMSTSFVLGGSGNTGVNNLRIENNDFQNAEIARLLRHGPGVNKSEMAFANNRYVNGAFSSSGWFQVGSTTTSFNTWKANVETTAQTVTAPYVNPIRSIAGYNASIGGSSSLSDFVDEAAYQMQGDYDDAYSAAAVINYVRKGFAEGGVIPGGLLPLPTGGATPNEPAPTDPTPTPVGDTTPPSTPSTLRATGASDTTVGMTWIPSADNVGVVGYEIFRGGVKIATATGTSYTDTGLNPSTAYVYTIRAIDAAGNVSGWSNNDTGTTLAPAADTTAPTAPANLAAGTVTTSSVALAWSAASDNKAVTGYRVFRNGTQVGTTTGTSYTDSGLTAATAYSYTVKAHDAAGNVSAASNAVTGTTSAVANPTPDPTPTPTAPAAPTGLTVEKRQRNKATLTWSDQSTNETGFTIYTSTDGVNWTSYATAAAQSGTGTAVFNTGGFNRGTRYFKVTAVGSGGESAASNVVTLNIS